VNDKDKKFVNKMAGGGDATKVPADGQQDSSHRNEKISAGGGNSKKVPSDSPPESGSNK
jgi:hypothetical protein